MAQLSDGNDEEPGALFARNSSPANTLSLHGHFSIL